jgi:glyoxylase-like metal-dependent hydrolase (beta-lactamase superfamily II)
MAYGPGVALRFLTDFDPRYGESVPVMPGIRRVVARNPSKYTAWGTGTYIVGTGEVAIIDPGPADDEHVEAVLSAVRGEAVTHLLVTHTHADHSPATAAVQDRTGAPTYGFGPHPAGADDESEEHGDLAFVPDVAVVDGDVIRGTTFQFECLHTPGHISNHVCYSERTANVLFTGDHVMGWSTTVISPPDGRIRDYLANLERLLDRDERVHYPTHGPPITDPGPYVAGLLEHRRDRERQILAEVSRGPRTVEEIVAVLYVDVRPELHRPAARSVGAHLVALVEEARVVGPDGEGRYRAV